MSENLKGKLRQFLKMVQEEHNVSLMVALKPDDSNLWDLVLGGQELDNQDYLKKFIALLNKILVKEDLIQFSRMVLINSDASFTTNFTGAFQVEGSDVELKNTRIDNVFIKEAHIFYSKK